MGEILPACEETGTAFAAYSLLGRGLLTGMFDNEWTPDGWDFRDQRIPRFQDGSLQENLALVAEVESDESEATPAQVALAWVLGWSERILTIPDTTKIGHVESNLAAADLTLTADQIGRLDTLADGVKSERHDERGMATVDG